MAQASNVIVIGGGIIGLAVAYYLRRAQLGVTLVERGGVGREASWAAAGYLSFQGESNQPGPRLELMRTSRLMYESWIEELAEFSAADTGFWRCGLLELCVTEAEARAGQERVAWQQAAGYPSFRITHVSLSNFWVPIQSLCKGGDYATLVPP